MTKAGDKLIKAANEAVEIAKCDHEGWTFEKQGRRCLKCGVFIVDFGD